MREGMQMKICITRTELYGMPDVMWEKFHDFFIDDNYIMYTPEQKVAAICWRYYYIEKLHGLKEKASSMAQQNSSSVFHGKAILIPKWISPVMGGERCPACRAIYKLFAKLSLPSGKRSHHSRLSLTSPRPYS